MRIVIQLTMGLYHTLDILTPSCDHHPIGYINTFTQSYGTSDIIYLNGNPD